MYETPGSGCDSYVRLSMSVVCAWLAPSSSSDRWSDFFTQVLGAIGGYWVIIKGGCTLLAAFYLHACVLSRQANKDIGNGQQVGRGGEETWYESPAHKKHAAEGARAVDIVPTSERSGGKTGSAKMH